MLPAMLAMLLPAGLLLLLRLLQCLMALLFLPAPLIWLLLASRPLLLVWHLHQLHRQSPAPTKSLSAGWAPPLLRALLVMVP